MYNILYLPSPKEAQETRTNRRRSRTGGPIFTDRIANQRYSAGIIKLQILYNLKKCFNKNVHQHLVFFKQTVSRKLDEVMTDFNKIQADYREESKKKIARQMEIAGTVVTDEELENMLEAGEGAMLMEHVEVEGTKDQLR